MKIYSMTATFGKLENQTLTLQPGLNVISAPNEWGKSTWCAFLVNMLYGLETRVKTTKTAIADKDRYAPWSGSPMSGRIDLSWNGRDITIERWSKGRTPMGEFRAYETGSGIAVPELTATTCGEMLLGVERSVFLRAGFLRLTDLPVTEDDALRRRLNSLVTTGDESGAADDLAQKLKDLKNKCRSNRANGLIPQAEAEKAELEGKLQQLQEFRTQSESLAQRQQDLLLRQQLLENHQKAVQYAAAQENLQKVEQAQLAAEVAAKALSVAEAQCAVLPERENAVEQLHCHSRLIQRKNQLISQWTAVPPEPQMPLIPERYRGMEPESAIAQAQEDAMVYDHLLVQQKRSFKGVWLLAAVLTLYLAIGILVGNIWCWGAMIAAMVITTAVMLYGRLDQKKRNQKQRDELLSRYPGIPPEGWAEDAARFAEGQRQYTQRKEMVLTQRYEIRQQLDAVEAELMTLTEGMSSEDFLLNRNQIIAAHDELAEKKKEQQRACDYADALRVMSKPVEKPEFEDHLSYSATETNRMLEESRREIHLLQQRLGQYQGLMESAGQEAPLRRQLDAVNARLDRLAQTYAALELAQNTLQAATAQLQSRFAPRISRDAQQILSRLTDGRYDRLTISQDLSLSAATGEETVLRAAQRRSEGTVDQIYLALRLAVSRALTPQAPFLLDDALVRFDDVRHAAAMTILKEEAENRQIILFTCQSREKS